MYSKIIAGTMTWGSWGKQLSKAAMISLMNHCLDLGITTFDHADIYGDFTNEEDFGKAYAESSIPREKIQLVSKCGIQFSAPSRKNEVKHYDYNKDYIIWSAERSLQKLNSDYLDLFLLHRPSPLMHPNEIAEAITKLKSDGKIKSFGVSNFTPSQIALIETMIPVEANQIEFSLTANQAMTDGSLDDISIGKRIGMYWSPLGSFFKEDNPQNKRISQALGSMKEKYNATADQLLLAWVLKHPSNSYPVVGTATPERLQAAVKATAIDLSLQDWFILLEASRGHEIA